MKIPFMKWGCLCLAMLFFSFGRGQTYINTDSLTVDMTLDTIGSPYILNGVFRIAPNVTLTIEAGVTVQFSRIWPVGPAHIIAKGTETDSIYFLPTPTSNSWSDISQYVDFFGNPTGGGTLEFEYCHFQSGYGILYGFANMTAKHCTFENLNTIEVNSNPNAPDSVIACNIRNCVKGINASSQDHSVIQNCLFENNQTGISNVSREMEILQNTFTKNHIGIKGTNYSQTTLIHHNEFFDNDTALTRLQISGNGISFQYNSVRDNGVGISMGSLTNPQNATDFSHNAFCNNDTSLYLLTNNYLNLRNNCWCDNDSTTIVQKIVAGFGYTPALLLSPFEPDCEPGAVYPGDANHDQFCLISDLFSIGLYYGQTGPVRPNASIQWVGQTAPDWPTTQTNGKNLKHADCDGDGLISAADTSAILQNLGEDHLSFKRSGTGVPLYFEDLPNWSPGGNVTQIPILLGDLNAPAENVYGISFSIDYDPVLIQKAEISFANSWLGTEGTDLLGIYQDQNMSGNVRIAMVRTDQTALDSTGQIGTLLITFAETLPSGGFTLDLDFSDVYLIDNESAQLEVNPIPSSQSVQFSTTIDLYTGNEISIYPNPAREQLWIKSERPGIHKLSIHDLNGRTISVLNFPTSVLSTNISLESLSEGIYLLEIETEEGLLLSRIQKH